MKLKMTINELEEKIKLIQNESDQLDENLAQADMELKNHKDDFNTLQEELKKLKELMEKEMNIKEEINIKKKKLQITNKSINQIKSIKQDLMSTILPNGKTLKDILDNSLDTFVASPQQINTIPDSPVQDTNIPINISLEDMYIPTTENSDDLLQNNL